MKWFRFHLSTMVAVTLVFGALLGLNLRPNHQTVETDVTNRYNSNRSFMATSPIDEDVYGWPTTMFVHTEATGYELAHIWAAKKIRWHEDELCYGRIAANCGIAFILCGIIALLLEIFSARKHITRTTAAKSPAPETQISGGGL